MKSEIAGLYNGHVVDERLVRSGELLDFTKAIPALRELKVSRVICLMGGDEQKKVDIERAAFDRARVEFFNIPLNSSGVWTWHDGERFTERILSTLALTPQFQRALIHCKHGSDRTGAEVACYRIQRYGWSADEAVKEMKKYGNAWYNYGMRGFVEDYSKKVRSI